MERRVRWTVAMVALSGAAPMATAQPVERGPGPSPSASPGAVPAPAPRVMLDEVAQAQLREQAVAVLADLAQNGAPEIRANAMEALIPAPTRLEPLARRALVDDNPGVRAVTAMAVGRAGLVGLADFVRPLLTDPSPLVRASAIHGLSMLANSPAGRRAGLTAPDPSPLARMLWSKDASERAHAAFVLGELGNASALPMLREVRRMPSARSTPGQERLWRLQLAEAMIKLGDDALLGEVRGALYPSTPEDLEATALAAQIVGQVSDRQSALQLEYLARPRKGPEGSLPPEVRLAATGALARMGDPATLWVADEYIAAADPAQRAQAAMVFGDSGRKDVLGAVGPLLSDPEVRVKVSAASAVLRLTGGR